MPPPPNCRKSTRPSPLNPDPRPEAPSASLSDLSAKATPSSQPAPAAEPAGPSEATPSAASNEPASSDPAKIRRWRRYLAEERAEAQTYRNLALRRRGREGEIFAGLAAAEQRHEEHWMRLLGRAAYPPPRIALRDRLLNFLASRLGSVFALALMQRSEARTSYLDDDDASQAMAADEFLHAEVVRALATQSRARLSGMFRAAVFGMNDGLVSNLALVAGIGGAGVSGATVLFTGFTGLVAGALSMAAGEYVSVVSQRELLQSTRPDPVMEQRLKYLNVKANELFLLFLARGESPAQAKAHEQEIIQAIAQAEGDLFATFAATAPAEEAEDLTAVGGAWQAAASSFLFFATGALIPVLPFLFGLTGFTGVAVAAALVGLTLFITGGLVGILSGKSPAPRGLRQMAIGLGAASVTYLLGHFSGNFLG